MLGDSHNFGRRVTRRGNRVEKPRTVFWESLFLDAGSPLRVFLQARGRAEGLGDHPFAFLGHLAVEESPDRHEGTVSAIDLRALRPGVTGLRDELARVFGRSLALWSWFGVADLHWENLALGLDEGGHVVFCPLDLEVVLGDFELPTETKLLPDADPEIVDVCRHAAGVRRLLPFLGKPVAGPEIVRIVAEARRTLDFLDGHAADLGELLEGLPGIEDVPVRILLRGTGDYVAATRGEELWPPLLDAEIEQLERGDIPYFFQTLGAPSIRWWADAERRRASRLPVDGDVPRPVDLLVPAGGLRSPNRRILREEGLATIVGAFDHAVLDGRFVDTESSVELRVLPDAIVLSFPDGAELETSRDLGAWVADVVLPCRCGEVASVLVPRRTRCSSKASAVGPGGI